MNRTQRKKFSTKKTKTLERIRKRKWDEDNAWYAKALEKDFFRRHPYYMLSDLPYYFFAYVDGHFGWEIYRPVKIVFLYDMNSHTIEYSRLIYDRNDDDILHPSVSFAKMGSKIIDPISVNEMFTFKPKDLEEVWDSGEYQIFIKSGNRKRFEYIISDNISKYIPFAWLFNLLKKVAKDIPYEMMDENGNWVDVHKYNLEHHSEMFKSEK